MAGLTLILGSFAALLTAILSTTVFGFNFAQTALLYVSTGLTVTLLPLTVSFSDAPEFK